jgi:transcriptional regulator with XRE-family HTH domain
MSKSESFVINQKVSRLLAAERKAKGITQAALAVKLKKPQSYVSKYENGQRQLTIADFTAICKAIGVKPSGFFKMFEGK